jgi:predicted acetyltransferase
VICQARSMETVEVTPASLQEQHTIENLMQLYIHDFSENWSGTDRGDVDQDGRFAPYPLESYWANPSHIPLLFRIANRIVGFSLLNGESHLGAPVERNVAEFFVLRKYRRGGVGTEAAHAMFARFPGVWEAAVARKNAAAQAFWRRAIESYPSASEVCEVDVRTELWNGPVLGFRC